MTHMRIGMGELLRIAIPRTRCITRQHRMEHWKNERTRLERELGEQITLDALTGAVGLAEREPWTDDGGGAAGWLIPQRKNGPRHSIDDVLPAWYALKVSPPVTEHLDLG